MTPDEADRLRAAIDELEPQAAILGALFAGRLVELRPEPRPAATIDGAELLRLLRTATNDVAPRGPIADDDVVADAICWAVRHCLGPRYDAALDRACRIALGPAIPATPVHSSPIPVANGTPLATRSKGSQR
jgi:hypothetical protein